MMALGSARPLQDTDLWKMDAARGAKPLSEKLLASYAARTKKANEYNARLADPSTPLPLSRRILYSVLPHRERREKDYREKYGKKHASLARSLLDVFGWFYMSAGFIKVFGDTCQAVTPLVIRRLITWSADYQAAKSAGLELPSRGPGIGAAVGLLLLLICSSLGMHHYFISELILFGPKGNEKLTSARIHGYRCSFSSCDHLSRVPTGSSIHPEVSGTDS